MNTDTQTPDTTADAPAPVPTPAPEKKGRQMSFSILDDGTIQAAFGPGLDPLNLNPSEVPEAIQLAAIAEGLISRARSYGSKLTDEERTSENLRVVIGKAFDNLRAGVWKTEREAGGVEYTVEVEAALVFRQLKATAKGETCTDTLESVATMWAGFTDDQKKTVKALPRYQQALAQVKARRAVEKAEKLAKKADQAEEDSPF